MSTKDKLAFVHTMSRLSLASLRDLQALMRYAQSYKIAVGRRDWRKANKMKRNIKNLCEDYGLAAYFEEQNVTVMGEGETVAVPTFEEKEHANDTR